MQQCFGLLLGTDADAGQQLLISSNVVSALCTCKLSSMSASVSFIFSSSLLRQSCVPVQEEPQGLSSNSLREYSDPSLHYSRPQQANSAARNPANPPQCTPATTSQQAGGRRAVDEGSSEQGHLRLQESGKPTRFQRDTPTGESPFASLKSSPPVHPHPCSSWTGPPYPPPPFPLLGLAGRGGSALLPTSSNSCMSTLKLSRSL